MMTNEPMRKVVKQELHVAYVQTVRCLCQRQNDYKHWVVFQFIRRTT